MKIVAKYLRSKLARVTDWLRVWTIEVAPMHLRQRRLDRLGGISACFPAVPCLRADVKAILLARPRIEDSDGHKLGRTRSTLSHEFERVSYVGF